MRRRLSRAMVLILFLGAGVFFFWQKSKTPLETELTFVLTDFEYSSGGKLLRYENITRLDCAILNEAGIEVAALHMRPHGATATPPTVVLPKGHYTLRLEITLLGPDGPIPRLHRHRTAQLDGTPTTIRL